MTHHATKSPKVPTSEKEMQIADREAEIKEAERRAWQQMSLREKIFHRLAFFASYFL
jgi:hypothetical protein